VPTLTIAGSPTFNGDTTTIHASADRIQFPRGDLNPLQGWFAMRLFTNGWDNAAASASGNYFFEIGPTVNDRISFYFGSAAQSGALRTARAGAGSTGEVQNFVAFSAGADITVVAKWNAAVVGNALNGAAFATVAQAAIPDLSPAALGDIGRISDRAAASWLDGTVYWVAAGTADIGTTESAALHAFGNTNPDFAALPGSPVMLWTAQDASYLEASEATPPTSRAARVHRAASYQ
jgi:hypothetical protein